ncbi:MAG: hypothetical protein JO092_07175, partial [Candidatus Eremiobacteraeota bacterium]|nr:hypothetical protein [Candidatus Eremiobacteraeota bacterium]
MAAGAVPGPSHTRPPETSEALRSLWRVAIIVLLLGSVPLYVLQFTLITRLGNLGMNTNYQWADSPPLTDRIVSVTADGEALRAGFQVGDTIPLAKNDRIGLNFPLAG